MATATAKRVRALFFKPGWDPDKPDFNVWVDFLAPDKVTLLHDYGADLRPEAGWHVAFDGKHYEVTDRLGLVLTVAERSA